MKRFYKQASAAEAPGGWQVQLDGRPLKTVGGRAQVVPSQPLAAALAAEWAAQGPEIDPATFMLRDLADYALDVIAADRGAAVAELLPYAETDTLCYRADPDEPLYARQQAVWEPLLALAETRWEVGFIRVSGVIHRPQPAETLALLRARLEGLDPFALAALRTLTSLAASLTLGLLALEGAADRATLWYAANLEEEWQADLWGRETEAESRRERRGAHFMAAARFADLAGG